MPEEIEFELATGEPLVKAFLDAVPRNGFIDLNFCRYGPDGILLPREFSKWSAFIRNLEVRPDDVWISTFSKCGTTWAQEMVWLICNNLNFAEAKQIRLPQRFPFLEVDTILEPDVPNSMERVAEMASPRFIKSHLPPSLFPKQLETVKPKIVVVVRNPKDACVSFYHHMVALNGYKGSLDDFVQAYVADSVLYSQYWTMTKALFAMRSEPNVLFLTFEEMKADLSAVVRKTSEFFHVHLTSEQETELVAHLSFEKMKTNKAVNGDSGIEWSRSLGRQVPENASFMRKGKVGSWREEMSEESVRLMDEWIKANGIAGLYDD